jgi:predicted transcriptional regulator
MGNGEVLEKMKKIKVQDKFKDDFVSRAAGERLRLMILDVLKKTGEVEVDFQNTHIASLSFLHEAIAKLEEAGISKADIRKKVRIVNISRFDEEIIT